MTDIRLDPDCELAKALDALCAACWHSGRRTDTPISETEARVQLLEVIREKIAAALLLMTLGEIGDEKACQVADEIMGVIEDD